MKAIMFPGQGSQYVGMGKSLYDNFSQSKDVFATIDQILGFKLSNKCFEGSCEELRDTATQQLAILAVSIAAYEAFRQKGIDIEYLSGLSLGEYSCLYAAGVLSLKDLVILVRERALAMQRAASANPSTMFVVIGMGQEELQDLAKDNDFYVANINSDKQIVISLKKDKIQAVKELLSPLAQRVVELVVSGGFHCRFMEPAKVHLSAVMGDMEFKKAVIPISSNFTAKVHSEPNQIRNNLLDQLVSPVLWRQCIDNMCKQGIKEFYEIGPSKVLRGLMRKINPAVKVTNLERAEDFDGPQSTVHRS